MQKIQQRIYSKIRLGCFNNNASKVKFTGITNILYMLQRFFSRDDHGGFDPELLKQQLRKANYNMSSNKRKLGIYAGSFNPMHVGHFNILQRAEEIFGRGNVILAIGCNPEKTTVKDQSEKAAALATKLEREVIAYDVFLDEFIMQKEEEGYDVFLIRGLRNGEDLAHEDNQLQFVEDFLDMLEVEYKLKTVFLRCDRKYDHISSSAIRAIDSFGEKGLKRSQRYKI